MVTQQILVNPGFEVQNDPDGSDPAGWILDPSWITMTDVADIAYAGGWCATFSGWSDTVTDYLYQQVDVPQYAIASLSFYLNIVNTTDNPASPACLLKLKIQDQYGVDLKTLSQWDCSNIATSTDWHQETFDVTEFADQTIRVLFTSTQTDGTKNASFYVDEVRIDTFLNLPVSSFPPLISDRSRDAFGQIQQYGSRVYCSCLIRVEPDDQFFNPLFGTGLNGYGANGSYYFAGIENPDSKASWWSEATGGGDAITRGATENFPGTALVTVTDESISILDQTDNLSLWMIFKKKTDNAYSDTFNLDEGARFTPTTVEYSNGAISVQFRPATGSTVTSVVILTIDFVQDFIYLDTSLASV